MKPMTEEHLAILRRHMVEVIAIHADLASDELGKATFDPRVMAVMTKVVTKGPRWSGGTCFIVL